MAASRVNVLSMHIGRSNKIHSHGRSFCVSTAVQQQQQQQRHNSNDVRFLARPEISALKKGAGGRSSFSGIVATIFGATGFLGRYVVNRLGKVGTQMILPYRGDFYEARHLKLMGDLGQVLFIPYNLTDEDAIRKAVKHSHVVINMVGRDWETMNFKYPQVHVEGAERIARISKEMGVEKFIYMSALNSNIEHEGYFVPGGSQFLKTKAEGEARTREIYPDAIVFRPSDVYGQEDRFLMYYVGNWRRQGKLMPLPKNGKDIWKQPVHCIDVAQGIVNAVKDSQAVGNIYEAVGPRRYELGELVDWFHRVMRKDFKGWGYMKYDAKYDPTFKLKAQLTELCPSWPVSYFIRDKIEREAISDTTTGLPTLEDLGVTLTKMESMIDWELKPFRSTNAYDEELGEFAPPEPPKYIAA